MGVAQLLDLGRRSQRGARLLGRPSLAEGRPQRAGQFLDADRTEAPELRRARVDIGRLDGEGEEEVSQVPVLR